MLEPEIPLRRLRPHVRPAPYHAAQILAVAESGNVHFLLQAEIPSEIRVLPHALRGQVCLEREIQVAGFLGQGERGATREGATAGEGDEGGYVGHDACEGAVDLGCECVLDLREAGVEGGDLVG